MPADKLLTFRDYRPDDESRDVLRRKLDFHVHTTAEPLVPTRVREVIVEKFLLDEVQPTLDVSQIRHASEIARFYRVRTAVEKFLKLLRKHEGKEEEYVASLHALRVAGELGDPSQQAAAAQYYSGLLRQAVLDSVAEDMIECYFHLDPAVTEEVAGAALTKRLEAAKADSGDPAKKDREVSKWEEHLENTLPATRDAKSFKQKIVAEADAAKRATALARVLLGVDDPGGVDWEQWASYALMGEALLGNDKLAVLALNETLPKIDVKLDETYVLRARAIGSRTIAFFGGKLSPEQTQWLAFDSVPKVQLEG